LYPRANHPADGVADLRGPGFVGPGRRGCRCGAGRADARQRLATAAQKLEVVVEQYNGLRVELRRSAARAAALRSRIAPLERLAEERSGEVGAVAAAAYRAGTGSPIFGLLAAGTPSELAQRLALLEHLGRGRNRAVAQLHEATASLAAARGELGALAARQKAQGAQLAGQKTRIEAEIIRLNTMRGGISAPLGPAAVRLPNLAPGKAAAAVRFAYAQLGKPYHWGGSGPGGYDCSA
jgi:cell wall-associated NlpC family hydrolase